ncbi:MAG TPA: SUMF1/EgtB/PvdO family nonheme iron enzyme [Leptolyngbyaceae cyanobacterium]
MTSRLTPSNARPIAQYLSRSLPEQRQCLRIQFDACRTSTLKLVDALTAEEYYRQSHPDFSPVGWHLGHIAFTEALWILEHLAGQDCPFPQYRRLFAADGLPKAERENLPDRPIVLSFLQEVRSRTWDYLEKAPLVDQHRLWWWLLQHESQHAETMSIVLALHRWKPGEMQEASGLEPQGPSQELAVPTVSEAVYFPATSFLMGYDGVDALDNEREVYPVQVNAFWIDRYPVTQAKYRQFMKAGGYENPQWWSTEGWAWLQQNPVRQPRYWVEDTSWDTHPVCGVSWYEADAYARFVGKRLPTECEWELAATWNAATSEKDFSSWASNGLDVSLNKPHFSRGHTHAVGTYSPAKSGCYDPLGNVWEWTSSWFEPYPNFMAFPYRGYSQAYFDQQHRVLRGGSWATFPWALRNTFRNWYHPHVRQIFAGFRCAQSAQ